MHISQTGLKEPRAKVKWGEDQEEWVPFSQLMARRQLDGLAPPSGPKSACDASTSPEIQLTSSLLPYRPPSVQTEMEATIEELDTGPLEDNETDTHDVDVPTEEVEDEKHPDAAETDGIPADKHPVNKPHATITFSSEPHNEWETDMLLTRCWPCHFPGAYGDPTLRCRDVKVPIGDAAKFLMQWGTYDDSLKRWVWPFQAHHKMSYQIHNVMLRQRALKTARTFIWRNKETAAMTVEELRKLLDKEDDETLGRENEAAR